MKKQSRKALVAKADKAFSIWVRNRGSIDGYNVCFTCGARKLISELQAGHFMSRRHYSTRWHPENVQVQDARCNVFNHGEQHLFGVNLDKKYGEGTADKLRLLSTQTVKLSTADLQGIIDKVPC